MRRGYCLCEPVALLHCRGRTLLPLPKTRCSIEDATWLRCAYIRQVWGEPCVHPDPPRSREYLLLISSDPPIVVLGGFWGLSFSQDAFQESQPPRGHTEELCHWVKSCWCTDWRHSRSTQPSLCSSSWMLQQRYLLFCYLQNILLFCYLQNILFEQNSPEIHSEVWFWSITCDKIQKLKIKAINFSEPRI